MRSLAGWDLAAWRMSKTDPALRATVVGIIELGGVVPANLLVERIHTVVSQHSVLRSVVVEDSDGARFVEVDRIDVNHHIHIPPTVIDIPSTVATFAQQDFDVARPLWRTLIITTGQRTLVAAAFHHAIADGQSAMAMLSQMLDEPPVLPQISTFQQTNTESKPLTEAVRPLLERAVKDPVGLAGDINRIAQSVNALLQMPLKPRESVRSGKLQFAAWEFDARMTSLNTHDAMVAIGVEAWRELTGDSTIVVNVPVGGFGGSGVNQFMIARLKLHANELNPASVAAQSRTALKKWRNEPAAVLLPQLVDAAQFLPTQWLGGVLKQGSIAVTTVRGDSAAGTIAGVAVMRVVPMVSPIGVAMNMTTSVLGSRVMIGVTVDDAVFASRSQLISIFENAAERVLGFTPTILTF